MNRLFAGVSGLAAALLACGPLSQAQETTAPSGAPDAPASHADKPAAHGPKKVMVIPVRSNIDKPALYVLRRSLKDAITRDFDVVVIDMDTRGGRLDVTFDMLKALEKFPGETLTFVDREATSAGAIISAGTDEIWMHPLATIGSAEPVTSTGEDINKSMQRKILSYLKAKMRAMTETHPYRGEVISAMMDPSVELIIDDQVISPKDDLLNLTATEASALFGDPARPLLAAGKADSISELLDSIYGKGNYTVERVEPSWSEELAHWLTAITPLLLAVGLLGLFIEFKTPGFGIFGVTGLILLVVVFFGHHVAGLSGYEPILVLLLGILLIAVEIFLLPGAVVPALAGGVLILGSLVWAMLDIWPDQPLELNSELLTRPLINLTAGVAGALVLFLALLRFLPGAGPWGGMILQAAVAGEPGGIHPLNAPRSEGSNQSDLLGRRAVAATDLYPSGHVIIDGKRYEARVPVGSVAAGSRLKVSGFSEFGLVVESEDPHPAPADPFGTTREDKS